MSHPAKSKLCSQELAKEIQQVPGVRSVNLTTKSQVLNKIKRGEYVSPATRRLLMLG